jgi:Ca2+/H+ antiporter
MAHLIHHWMTLAPLEAAALLVLTTTIGEQPWLLVGCVAALIAAVLAAVHHAEVIAHREQSFRVDGAGGELATLIVLAVVTLVLPDFTITTGVGT